MMKQMPYRVEEGAIERAKYRAKMAVRESANGAVAPRGNRHILQGCGIALVARGGRLDVAAAALAHARARAQASRAPPSLRHRLEMGWKRAFRCAERISLP